MHPFQAATAAMRWMIYNWDHFARRALQKLGLLHQCLSRWTHKRQTNIRYKSHNHWLQLFLDFNQDTLIARQCAFFAFLVLVQLLSLCVAGLHDHVAIIYDFLGPRFPLYINVTLFRTQVNFSEFATRLAGRRLQQGPEDDKDKCSAADLHDTLFPPLVTLKITLLALSRAL